MYSRHSMLRALRPYLVVFTLLTVAAGWAYGDGTIGVPGFYGAILLGGLIGGVGYLRWEARHYN